MAYPSDLPTVTVRHRIVGTDGTPARGGGKVTAVLTGRLWTGQGSVVPTQYTATVQEDGTYELVLPPVDHPDIVAGRGEAYLVTEPAATIDTRRPGRVATEQFHVAPTTDMVGQTVDVSDVLVNKPKPGGGVERVTITGPATDESLAGIIADPSSQTAVTLKDTIEAETDRVVPAKVAGELENQVADLDLLTTASAAATFARRIDIQPVAARGAVTISWDDGWVEWLTVLLPILRDEFPHQAHTFAFTPDLLDTYLHLSTEQAQTMMRALPHCEIASHSQTHANVKDAPVEQRIIEYDQSKADIEQIFGVTPTSFVYPYGGVGQDATTDIELWGRYDRVVSAGRPMATTPLNERLGVFDAPRLEEWNSGTHQRMLDQVRLAARQPVIVNIYSHRPGTTTTVAELRELFSLCDELGVPVVNIRDAYPAGSVLTNPLAENGTASWGTASSGSGKTFGVDAVSLPAGLPGTSAFHLRSTEEEGFIYAYQWVPATEGRSYTFSGRGMRTHLGGSGSYTRLRVQPIDRTGASLGPVFSSADVSDEWEQLVATGVMPEGTGGARLDLIQLNTEGESWFTHLHFGLTANGVFG